MSQTTRMEVLAKKRARYARAGKEPKTKIITELVGLFDYHRKAAIRALQPRPVLAAPFVIGRPREYDPEQLRGPLKAIWLAALQPCGVRGSRRVCPTGCLPMRRLIAGSTPMCGGTLDDRHGWMFDAVDIHTTWNEMRALPNRSEAATLLQIGDVEATCLFRCAV